MSRQPTTLSSDERLDWLRLLRSENVGPITFYKLLERFGTVKAALDSLPDLARRGGGRRIKMCTQAAAAEEIDDTIKAGAQLMARGEADYPPLLAHVEDAPPLISVLGHSHILRKKAVAIVGTRNASINGLRLAESFAAALGAAGYMVVSGMARGIDAAAHRGGLATGTVAALAGGVDIVYPKENSALYESIIDQGAALSEMPIGTIPQARHIPRRNRLISGISRGVVIVEAAKRSGSLITARMAGEQNRELFALPGSPLDPRAGGTNDLIRDGAHLVQNPDDVIEILNGLVRTPLAEREPFEIKAKNNPQPSESEVQTARVDLKKLLNTTPVTVDELIRRCQMSPAIVSTILLELELAGQLERHPGNRVSLIVIQ